jgi:hypothetical protein
MEEITLDTICRKARGGDFINALHACRKGHPLNKLTKQPWANARFMASGRHELDCRDLDWLDKQVAKEEAALLIASHQADLFVEPA